MSQSSDLLIAFDGSWAEDTYKPTDDDTNVGRAARAWPGVCWYQEGVGSRHGLVGKYLGGVFGMGLHARVKELENNIALWRQRHPLGELHGIGWSRGAVGLISLANSVRFDSLRLLDPVPGPFKPRSWKLGNPGCKTRVLYCINRKPFYRPVKLEGRNVEALYCADSHQGLGRNPQWLAVVSLPRLP
jgi:hypothetical protein